MADVVITWTRTNTLRQALPDLKNMGPVEKDAAIAQVLSTVMAMMTTNNLHAVDPYSIKFSIEGEY